MGEHGLMQVGNLLGVIGQVMERDTIVSANLVVFIAEEDDSLHC